MKTILTKNQILGLAPISEKELNSAILEAEDDIKNGRYTEFPGSYAEFRKALGLNEKISHHSLRQSQART
ncbi:hypothetical protein IKG48_02805 [Candidatus Saccharibacteria bacterium]|nr:hypothetical protein [Candidatus Saccharibacteria bacterium]